MESYTLKKRFMKNYKIEPIKRDYPFFNKTMYALSRRHYLSVSRKTLYLEILGLSVVCFTGVGLLILIVMYLIDEDFPLFNIPFGWDYIQNFEEKQDAYDFVAED